MTIPSAKQLLESQQAHDRADALMSKGRIVVGDWEYFTTDVQDDDMPRRLRHFVINTVTGEQKDISFVSHSYMMSVDIFRLQEMGWPAYNYVLGYPGSAWTSRDIELAWLRGLERLRADLPIGRHYPRTEPDPFNSFWWIAAAAVIALTIFTFV